MQNLKTIDTVRERERERERERAYFLQKQKGGKLFNQLSLQRGREGVVLSTLRDGA